MLLTFVVILAMLWNCLTDELHLTFSLPLCVFMKMSFFEVLVRRTLGQLNVLVELGENGHVRGKPCHNSHLNQLPASDTFTVPPPGLFTFAVMGKNTNNNCFKLAWKTVRNLW